MSFINRNVVIVIVILVLVVLAGYLVWLRNQYQPQVSPQFKSDDQIIEATPTPTKEVASPAAEEASPTAKVTPIKAATGSGSSR